MKIYPEEMWAVVMMGGWPTLGKLPDPNKPVFITYRTLSDTRQRAIKRADAEWDLDHAPHMEYRLLRRRGFAKAVRVKLVLATNPEPQE